MGRAGLQFLLLLWKNYVLQKRKVIVTIVEIALPALFSLILIFIRQRVTTEDFSKGKNYSSYNMDQFDCGFMDRRPICYFQPLWQLYYTPDNPFVAQIMNDVSHHNVKINGTKPYQSEAEMVSAIMKDFQGTDNSTIKPTTSDILGGIVFETFPKNMSDIPTAKDIKYKIRLRFSWSGGSGSISDIFSQEQNNWHTQFMYPLYQIMGPRNINNTKGGPPGYWRDGFLTLQYQLDCAILKAFNSSVRFPPKSVHMRRFPYPPWINDNFVLVLQQQFPFLLLLSFIFSALHIVKNVVHEKERKLKETLKMMGINNWLHWSAWFVKYFLFLLMSVSLMTLLLCVQASSHGSVVGYTAPSVLFVFLLFYAISTISFCFMVSVFFSKANSGAAAGGVLFFMTYIPYMFLQPRYDQLSWAAKMSACLISNTAMSFGGQVIGMYEGTGKGVQWSNLNTGVTVDDNFTMLHVLLMLLADSVLYGLVTWYVETVFPGEYGVPRVWYFSVQPSYWCGTKPIKATTLDENTHLLTSQGHSRYFEADPMGLNTGIKMNNLKKVYKSASSPAVQGTSLSMYEGQITALLGHNGAGKTTTISMLTGFIPPTSGSAVVNGYDITEDIDSVRESIGLCPQHDVLFDNMTVEEHLWFFAKLKGVERGLVSQEINRYLTVLGLPHKRHARSKTLSGGQKRKLSVGIALIGDSKVVILDEPTSGMDPNARRQTWEILQQHKNGRTLILTTHHMDEADVLGDRIAIMAAGVVKCCGTPLFLKNKYGAGYHLVIVKSPDCDVDPITELIQKHVPTMQLESNISAEVRYRLPYESKASFESLFTELEANMADLLVTSFGVSVTTMEEVFLKVGEDAGDAEEIGYHDNVSNESSGSRLSPSGATPSVNNPVESHMTVTRKQGGFLLYVQQFSAMFIKRALHTRRKLVVTIAQLLVPLVFTTLALIVIKTIPNPQDLPPLILNMSYFAENQALYSVNAAQRSHDLSNLYRSQFNMYPKVNTVEVTGDMEKALIQAGKHSLADYNENYLVAASFDRNSKDKTDTTVWFNNQAYHTPAMSLAVVMNTWLQYYTGRRNVSITTVNHPLPRSLQQKINDEFFRSFEGFTVAFNVLFGMSFLVSSFTLFLIKERATKAKHVQFVSGVHSVTFWLSTFCWDFINFLFPAAVLLVLFAAFGIEAYSGAERIWYIALLFLLFGWAVLPFMYLLSFIFTVPSAGLVWLTMFNILSGVATVLAVDILSIPQLNTTALAHSLEWTFITVLPNFCLGQGMEDFYENYQFQEICERTGAQKLCAFGPNPCCKDNCGDFCLNIQENYLAWDQGGIGRMLTFLALQGIVYFLLLLLIESELLKMLWYKLQSIAHGKGRPHHRGDEGIVQEDSDVAIERQRIATTSVDTLCGLDMLVMTELTKYYGNLLAVKSLSVGIPQGECFGLLGVNGAGKTTTFKMLTGDEMVTSGEAYLDGYNVKQNIKQVQQRLGYCPQFDALIDHMTGLETLTMYARLRGVNERDIQKVVVPLLKDLLLEEHASKLVKAYSGGNKRKLSTAIALVGSPPIIFLDEPSTGMDPVARRQLWDTLSRVRAQGSTLILTSHSMEECEALCTRLAIMVNGQFKCMGSPQHLKNKFGEGYTLIAKVKYPSEGGAAQPNTQPFISFINATFPGSILKDVHQGMLHFHITAPSVTWSQLFSVLEKSGDKYDLEDYSISQTSLEQVFINFARAQIPPREVTPNCCSKLGSCREMFCFCCGCCCHDYRLCPCGSHDPEELQVLLDEDEQA